MEKVKRKKYETREAVVRRREESERREKEKEARKKVQAVKQLEWRRRVRKKRKQSKGARRVVGTDGKESGYRQPSRRMAMKVRRRPYVNKRRGVVDEAWVSGRRTNRREFKKMAMMYEKKREVVHLQSTKGREQEGSVEWYTSNLGGVEQRRRRDTMPSRRRVRNPKEHEVARKEAERCAVPTVTRESGKKREDSLEKSRQNGNIKKRKLKGSMQERERDTKNVVAQRTRRRRRRRAMRKEEEERYMTEVCSLCSHTIDTTEDQMEGEVWYTYV